MTTNTNINFPQAPFLDPTTQKPSLPWLLWLQNPNVVGFSSATPLGHISGGTGVNNTPSAGQLLIGNGTGYTLNTLTAGGGINIVNAAGSITISAGNANISAGTYGSSNQVPQLTFDSFGALTKVTNVAIALDAAEITTGTINPSRISGSYTGITGVGTLTTGTWDATPIAVLYGGTGATTASGARTNLGLGSGLSVTITTAKLTTGGTNGSMTFVNGILTAQTQAT